jgi:hypothetical protein
MHKVFGLIASLLFIAFASTGSADTGDGGERHGRVRIHLADQPNTDLTGLPFTLPLRNLLQ